MAFESDRHIGRVDARRTLQHLHHGQVPVHVEHETPAQLTGVQAHTGNLVETHAFDAVDHE